MLEPLLVNFVVAIANKDLFELVILQMGRLPTHFACEYLAFLGFLSIRLQIAGDQRVHSLAEEGAANLEIGETKISFLFPHKHLHK